jgi:hypothetical protein
MARRAKNRSSNGEIIAPPARQRLPDRPRRWSVEHHGRNVHAVKIARPNCRDFSQWILLIADNHIDSTAARNDILTRLLAEAVQRDAVVIGVGDQLDLMQGVADKRGSKAALRSTLLSDNYFDRVIDQAADLLAPYASHIAVLADGNHETSWRRFHESCPTTNLVRAIKDRAHSPVGAGGYGGWIVFQIKLGNLNMTYRVRYQHGTGGGNSPMTMGMLDARRMYSWIEGADSIIISHNHASNVAGIAREYLSTQNGIYKVETRYADFIRVGTTKAAWEKSMGAAGWEVEKGFGPSPIRQKWVRLYLQWETSTGHGKPRMAWDVHDAQ